MLLFCVLPGCVNAMAAVDPATLPVGSEVAIRLRTHVRALAGPELKGRKPGTEGNRAAARYIATHFREAELVSLPSLNGYGQTITPELGDNLIGVRPVSPQHDQREESEHPYGWIVVGAHYDHLGESLLGKVYAGADDNAAAVAILLELAKRLPELSNHPILFVAFNAEEPPFIRTPLMGSQVFVDHLPSEIGAPAHLHAVIIMDLMGGTHWEPLKDTIFAVGAEKSPGLYSRVRSASVRSSSLSTQSSALGTSLSVLPVGMHLLEELPVVGHHPFSDYDAFRNASVPFVFLSAGRTPRYHQPTDQPETLHYERMAATVAWLDHLVKLIDQDRAPYRFDPGRLELADEIETLRMLVEHAAQESTQIPGTSALSRYRLKQDAEWLSQISAETLMKSEDREEGLRRLEKISIRIQCLLADFYGCGLF